MSVGDPEILSANSNNTTSAVALTGTDVTMVAAPGVGSRIRVYGIHIVSKPDNTGAVRVTLKEGTTGTVRGGYSTGTNRQGEHVIYPWGLPLAENNAAVLRNDSNVASQAINQTIDYVIESV